MNNNPVPRKFDAVLGGQAPPPIEGVVLGGLVGLKSRLQSTVVEARVAALSEALNYGEVGLDLVIRALQDKFRQVRHSANLLLQQRPETQVKLALKEYKFWSGFERLNGYPEHAITFANRKVENFDPKIGIVDPIGTAYALRAIYEERYRSGRKRQDMDIPDKLQLLLQDDSASQVEALVFGKPDNYNPYCVVNLLIDAYEQLTNLKALFIGDIEDHEDMISSIVQSDLSLIFVAYPDLEVLKVRSSGGYGVYREGEGLTFQPLQHDKLKALIIESSGLRREVIHQICKLDLPELEYLELWLGTDRYGGTSSIKDLMPIISGELFPKLKYLGLRNSEYTDDIAAAIVKSPIIEQLIELDLSMGNLGDDGAQCLLDCPAVNQLDTLNVSQNCLRPMVSQLKQLDIDIVVFDQKGSQHRYCSVAE